MLIFIFAYLIRTDFAFFKDETLREYAQLGVFAIGVVFGCLSILMCFFGACVSKCNFKCLSIIVKLKCITPIVFFVLSDYMACILHFRCALHRTRRYDTLNCYLYYSLWKHCYWRLLHNWQNLRNRSSRILSRIGLYPAEVYC